MPPVFPRRRADRFAELVDQPAPLRRPKPKDRDLADLADVADDLRYCGVAPAPDPAFRADLRARLVAAAESDETEDVSEPAPAARVAPARFERRTRMAVAIGLAAGVAGVAGMAAASSAGPGDSLYSLKRSAEQAQLAVAISDVERGGLHLNFARKRMHEAVAVSGDSDEIHMILHDMDADTRKGVKLLTAAAVAGRDPGPLDTIAAFVKAQAADIPAVMADISGAAHGRAIDSGHLLDDVRVRIGWLRADLSCTDIQTARVDDFGPVPLSCAARDSQRPSRPPTTTPPPAPTASPEAEHPTPAGTAASPTPSPLDSALPSPASLPAAEPVQEVVKVPDVIEVDPQSPAPSPLREPPVDMSGLPSLVGDF